MDTHTYMGVSSMWREVVHEWTSRVNVSHLFLLGEECAHRLRDALPIDTEGGWQRVSLEEVEVQRIALGGVGSLVMLASASAARSKALYVLVSAIVTVVLGVGMVAFVLLRFVSGRKEAVVIATMVGGGVHAATVSMFSHITSTYPSVCASYVGLCAIVGYALVTRHFDVSQGIPPWIERSTCYTLRMTGAIAVLHASGDVRTGATALGTVVALALFPCLLPTRGPARAPTTYGSNRARWRPPTASGKYLTREEYELLRDRTTQAQLHRLFSSAPFHTHLMRTHAGNEDPDE